jgi:hypothetical protein
MSGFNQDASPQFGKAEYVDTPGNDHCQYCHQPISGTYYHVNDTMACARCVAQARSGRAADSHAAYVRALALGFGAAVLGMIAYAAIGIMTQGWVISLMSVGVGWLVGAAMMKGSNGVGGRRYQIAAALLTYAAVSTAAVPIWIHFANLRNEHRQTLQEEQRQLENESGQPHEQGHSPATQQSPTTKNLLTWMGRLILLGLASPFIELADNPGWGAIGLLILFYGIRFAWRIAAGQPFHIYGPFDSSPPSV